MNNKINICLYGNDFKYEVENVAKLFIDAINFHFTYDTSPSLQDYIILSQKVGKNNFIYSCIISINNKKFHKIRKIPKVEHNSKTEFEYNVCRIFYDSMVEFTNIHPYWGMITGIRPVAMANKLAKSGFNNEKMIKYFREKFDVSVPKIELLNEISQNQSQILSSFDSNTCSVYISIPFCPARCSYCSFVSSSVANAGNLISSYFELLLEEIETTANIIMKNKYKVISIYIGGGTPTILSLEQLKILLSKINSSFNLSYLKEYCLEAGRADTITIEKCFAAKKLGINRTSVNPQTFTDEVLQKLGRNITSNETIKSYYNARNAGIDNINMDLIAGLPGETYESFAKSFDKCISLNPENITLHALTLKRSSDLFWGIRSSESSAPERMIEYANTKFHSSVYKPYYLYRQKNTLDNLENTGWGKEGTFGIYNILMMDDSHTVFGIGAGASTKIVDFKGKITRIHNFKYPYEYINSFDKLLEKKSKIGLILNND